MMALLVVAVACGFALGVVAGLVLGYVAGLP